MDADQNDPLTSSVREEVIHAQFEISKTYWREFAVVARDGAMLPSHISPSGLPQPREPAHPHRVFAVLGRYAVALFDCEHTRHVLIYLHTLEGIAARTESVLRKNILEFQSASQGRYSLTFHATIDEMLSSVRKRLREHIETLPRPFTVELSPVETRLVQVGAADPIRTIRERLDAAALLSGHKAVWDAIGISRSNYFEVKAGRGGRKAKAKTDLYLSRLERNVKDANLN